MNAKQILFKTDDLIVHFPCWKCTIAQLLASFLLTTAYYTPAIPFDSIITGLIKPTAYLGRGFEPANTSFIWDAMALASCS